MGRDASTEEQSCARLAAQLSRIEELRREGLMQSGSAPRLEQIGEALVLEEGELVTLMQAELDSTLAELSDREACITG